MAALGGTKIVNETESREDPLKRPGFSVAMNKGIIVSKYKLEDGSDIFGGYLHDKQYPWILAVEINSSEVLAPVKSLFQSYMWLSALGILIILAGSYWFAKGIVTPVIEAAKFAQVVGEGDLTNRLQIRSQDEIGQLGIALNDMADNMSEKADLALAISKGDLRPDVKMKSGRDVLGAALQKMNQGLTDLVIEMQTISTQVAQGSDQIAGANQSLAQCMVDQASGIQQITDSVEVIAGKSRKSAESTRKANQMTSNMEELIRQGNGYMSELISAIGDMAASNQEISNIIKMIDDIAFQTNLLALNAAVEADHVGQHGKGFAVVAEEVRTLASLSARAARETAERIESSEKKFDRGTALVNQTASSLDVIVKSIMDISEIINEISFSMTDQVEGIFQINTGLNRINDVTQQATASTEESASAAEELTGHATTPQNSIQ